MSADESILRRVAGTSGKLMPAVIGSCVKLTLPAPKSALCVR